MKINRDKVKETAKKIIYAIFYIVIDAVKLHINCLIVTILVAVCLENGWVFYDHTNNVTNEQFLNFYRCICVIVPVIMGYWGFTGKYNKIVKERNKSHIRLFVTVKKEGDKNEKE